MIYNFVSEFGLSRKELTIFTRTLKMYTIWIVLFAIITIW